MTTRLLMGLVIGGLLTLCKTYPAYARSFSKLDLFKPIGLNHPDRMAQGHVPNLIKPPEEALTLSRFKKDGEIHTLAVLTDDGKTLAGVDLSAELKRYDLNVFEVIRNFAFDDIVKLIRNSTRKVTVNYKDLLPSVAGKEHVAIGINYAEHGKETGQIKPFLFPKIVATNPAIHQLGYTDGWLLDHEVELGIVFPSPVCSVAELDKIMIGFLVVNDFTDRATLMRKMDSKNITGGKGFPDAKSKKGFLPTGPYLVIPKNWRTFVQELHLQLSVNGTIRQHGNARDMVWNIDQIIQRTLAMSGKKDGYFQDRRVNLFEGKCIPANSIIITGTPAGVVFNAPGKAFISGAVMHYIFTGAFFHKPMHSYILQRYLKKEMSNSRYLKPGDHIESSISYLGAIQTTVVKEVVK